MAKESVVIPQHIDGPIHLLLWPLDVWIPTFVGLASGFFIGALFLSSVLGVVGSLLFKRFSDGRPDGFLLHFLYWYGLYPTKGHSMKNPFVEEWAA